ncbi:hypothetical protein [Hydrogenophaga sp.]|uniref:hypothetical protein n=1 Tax=Hydrogenophaga sp. TaxID=1904254 RepID=UPI003F711898
MTTTVDVVTAGAAFVSAIGGAIAAWAAFKSARSAQKSQESGDALAQKFALRDVALAAGEVRVESNRVLHRAQQLKLSYRDLFIMSGSAVHSSEQLCMAEIEKKVLRVSALAADAANFSDGADNLKRSTIDDIFRVETRLTSSIKEVRAIREDLDRENDQIDAQCAERRKRMENLRFAR